MSTARLRYPALVLVVVLLASGILACDIGGGGEPAKPTIVITAPTSGAEFQVGEEVNVLSSASDAKGVIRVELYVDGVLFRTDPSPDPGGNTAVAMYQTWTAESPGSHSISVIAVNVDGVESDAWATTIRVVGEAAPSPSTEGGPPPMVTATLEVTATETVQPPPPAATATVPPPTPTVNPDAPLIKYFRANGQDDSYTAIPGESVILSWEWERVEEGYLDPGNLALACPTMPCTFVVVPEGTTTYTLKAKNPSATTEASVTVEIGSE